MLKRFKKLGGAFVEVRAERKLKEVAAGICHELTPEQLTVLARNNVSLFTVLKDTGRKVPDSRQANSAVRAGLDYLVSLDDDYILELWKEGLPDHVAVLRRYPQFASQLINEIKSLA